MIAVLANQQLLLSAHAADAAGSLRSPAAFSLRSRRSRIAGVMRHQVTRGGFDRGRRDCYVRLRWGIHTGGWDEQQSR